MATLFPTPQIKSLQDFLPKNVWQTPSGPTQQSIFAEKPLATDTPGITQNLVTQTGPAATGSPGGQVQNVTAPVQTNGLAGTPQTTVPTPQVSAPASATPNPAFSFYTPTTPNGQYVAGAQVADHTDTAPKYTWGIAAGDREGGGATMLTSYNGNADLARWSYAQNSNESSWDHFDRLRHDLMKNYGWNIQQASDEALKEMYAAYQAAGADWSKTGFGEVPGVKKASQQTGTGTGAGAGAGNGAGAGSGSGTSADQGGTGSGLNSNQIKYLQDNPDQAFRQIMEQQGYNVDAPGLMAAWLKRKYTPLIEAALGTAVLNNGGDAIQAVPGMLNDIQHAMFTPGADIGTYSRNLARQTIGNQNTIDYLNSLGGVDSNSSQADAEKFVRLLAALDTFGAPGVMQQALSDRLQRAENQYGDLSFNQEFAGHNIDPYWKFLLNNPNIQGLFGK